MRNLENPFSVLKATEFTNEEINELWVDFGHGKNSVFNLLNPTTNLPKYLLGSKGTGKTHILKYASYPLQKIKANGDFNTLLEEKYIGLYYELYGFNASRFKGKGIDSDQWSSVFEYYLDLFLADNLLKTYNEVFQNLKIEEGVLQVLIGEILKIFNNESELQNIDSIDKLIDRIAILRRKIDSEINNVAYTRVFNLGEIKSLFTPGDLIFGIPEIVSKFVNQFEEIKIIYILDEIEKLEEWQKEYINTLVWDKRKPVTFWLGMRTWGYTTWNTKTSEIIRDGHEFIKIDLDSFIATNENLYPEFVKNLYSNRLNKYYRERSITLALNDIQTSFEKKFEQYKEEEIINYFTNLGGKKELAHITRLKDILKKAKFSTNEVEIITKDLLSNEKNVLFQKYKLFKFYKDWFNLKNDNRKYEREWTLLDLVKSINEEYSKFEKGESLIFSEIVDKRKKDFIAQICVENKEPAKNIEHSGLESFIERSQGNPRNFLMLLMKCVEIANVQNELPLEENGLISLETQFRSLYDTSEWFYKTIEIKGEEAKRLYDSLQFLSEILKLNRYCDKPTETSVFCFNITSENLSVNSKAQIRDLEIYSIIIKDENGRREKNSSRKEIRYNLNRILCPLWGLPIKKRGVLDLNAENANLIFDYTLKDNFQSAYNKMRTKFMAPFPIENLNVKITQKKLEL